MQGQVVLPDGGIGEQAVRAALKYPNTSIQQKATFALQQISERDIRLGGFSRTPILEKWIAFLTKVT